MKREVREGIWGSIPIVLAYIPVAMAFGLLCRVVGLTLWQATAFSFVLYAGAGQFLAVSMIASGAGFLTIVASVCLLNLRLFMMATSLAVKTKRISKVLLAPVGFMMTDEAFSVASFHAEKISNGYMIALEILPYVAWGVFTMVGFLIGEILPAEVAQAMDVGLTALFVALLVPSVKKNFKMIPVIFLTAIIFLVIEYTHLLKEGWDMVAAILLSSTLGMLIYEKEDRS